MMRGDIPGRTRNWQVLVVQQNSCAAQSARNITAQTRMSKKARLHKDFCQCLLFVEILKIAELSWLFLLVVYFSSLTCWVFYVGYNATMAKEAFANETPTIIPVGN